MIPFNSKKLSQLDVSSDEITSRIKIEDLYKQSGLSVFENHKLLEKLVGRSAPMQAIRDQVARVSPTLATVLITGESGTGKEVTAITIHQQSTRNKEPFVAVNCGAMSPQLIESELFGHEKGSFTGAFRSHRGVFEQAHGGTLFLDEITEMPIDLQVKLLRVLETRRFTRVGSEFEQKTDVRIIAATNRCPQKEVDAGTLREDLLYRLQIFPIELPPLRERHSDVRELACLFLSELNTAEGSVKTFSDDVFSKLECHAWPGNIRELRNVVQRAYIMAETVISQKDLPPGLGEPLSSVRQKGRTLAVQIGTSVAEVEKNLIFATLNQCGGSRSEAAYLLGVSLKTLYNRLRKYEIQSASLIIDGQKNHNF
jgi:DNA-binding NtrC family response regulator